MGNVCLKHEFGESHTQSYNDHGGADQCPKEPEGSPFIFQGEFLDGKLFGQQAISFYRWKVDQGAVQEQNNSNIM